MERDEVKKRLIEMRDDLVCELDKFIEAVSEWDKLKCDSFDRSYRDIYPIIGAFAEVYEGRCRPPYDGIRKYNRDKRHYFSNYNYIKSDAEIKKYRQQKGALK